MRPRIFVSQPVAESAIARLREVGTVKVNPDSSRIIAKRELILVQIEVQNYGLARSLGGANTFEISTSEISTS